MNLVRSDRNWCKIVVSKELSRIRQVSSSRLLPGSLFRRGEIQPLGSFREGVSVADRFQTTRWSVVLAAARGGEGSAEALEWLCATYWYPLYGYIRRRGHDSETARDLTQSFFLSLLDRNSLRRIDPDQGKFRSFLLASVKNFLSHERDREHAVKRRPDDPDFRLDFEGAESRYLREGGGEGGGLNPEDLYESRWARTVLDRALRRLGEEHETAGKAEMFRRLSGHLTGEETPYDGLAADLGLTTGALRVTVHRLRRRLGALLRAEVAQTVSSSAEIDGEIRNLLQAIGRIS
jgi:RNA polymerase sigma factor (sigma-70 family)